MATKTYEPIATYTTTGTLASYTFSSIPSTYTDIILVAQASINTGGGSQMFTRVNGDTGNNYAATLLSGSASTTFAGETSNSPQFYSGYDAYMTTSTGFVATIHFMSYTDTSKYKTMIAQSGNYVSGAGVTLGVGNWRSTGAINSITVFPSANSFATGSSFTLYGIKAAA